MKVILFALNGRGGMLHYTSQYANALSQTASVTVILPDYADTSLFSSKVKLKKIRAPPTVFGTGLQTIQFWKHSALLSWIKRQRPNAIQYMDNHPWYIHYARSLRSFFQCATIHDPQPHKDEYTGLRYRGVVAVTQSLCTLCKHVFVHGKLQKKVLEKQGCKAAISIIPHGDYSFFTNYPHKQVAAKKNHLLFFGRILKYKGVDVLLRALPDVIKKIPDVHVTIAGEGDITPYAHLVSSSIKKHVTFINKYIPESKVGQLFQETSLVVLPYTDASQTGIIPVAYAFRKPAISTTVGSIPEVIQEGKTGFLVPPKNPKVLATVIIKALQQDLGAMGEQAYTFLKKHMSWEHVAETCKKNYPNLQPLSVINAATHEKVFQLLRNKKGIILDLGAGTGNLSERLHANNQNVIAADFNKEAFKPALPFTAFSIENNWPYKDKSIDHIACIEVIEHLENPWHLFREAYRVMKPGGTFIVTTPNVNNIFSRLLFVLKGRFAHFGLDLNYLNPHKPHYIDFHKSPIFVFLLKEMAYKKFILKKIHVNRSVIPFTNVPLPFKGVFWGESAIYELQKIKNTTSKR